ncbi:hypothetical protein V5O48_007316 [Marasmius crinis-equi]|uniref:Uncharacterized protein n=1 Tax=Marasmius crinis-equi TaxID=585013 RepID=A0ABR3FHA0_9AGAR
MAQFFSNSSHTKIGDHPVFQHVSGDANITNLNNVFNLFHKAHHQSQLSTSLAEDKGVTLTHAPREIDAGDIILRKEVSSQDFDLSLTAQNSKLLKPTNPFRDRIRAVRVKKRVYTAEILRRNVRDLKFTVVTFEPEDPSDRKRVGALNIARSILANDETAKKMGILITGTWDDWTFNLKTGSWQYDVPSISILGTNKKALIHSLSYSPPPLPEYLPPGELKPHSIIAHFERCFGDFIHTCSNHGEFMKFFVSRDDLSQLVFVGEVRFSLGGTFLCDPGRQRYLFVPPIPVEIINNMPCIRWDPTTTPLFYWCSDPEGKERIPETDWEKHGIPKLQVETWIGTSWSPFLYDAIVEYLRMKNYNICSEQYALEMGYPIISQSDPHKPDTGDRERLVEDVVTHGSGFASPSTYSLIEVPDEASAQTSTEMDGKKGVREGTVARWVKGLLQRDDKPNIFEGENLDSDRWSVVDIEREGS